MASSNRIKEMSIDRISALPEPLILHILNFLGVRSAGITSVLSKRWRYLWTDLPGLSFQEDIFPGDKREFVSWVNRTLILRSVKSVERFEIIFDYDEYYASDVTTWVEFAVKNKVRELILVLPTDTESYLLPQVMYSASSLTLLSTHECIVAPSRKIEWKSLTQLQIDYVELQDDVIAKILADCPVLHSLSLLFCWGYNCLKITSPSLDSLWISDREGEETAPKLEISAPFMQALDVSIFPIGRKKLCLTNIASLFRAYINFELVDNSVTVEALNNTREIFENIRHVKKLEVGNQCFQVISELVMTGRLLPRSNRVSLIIYPRIYESCIPGIVGLLESSPNLDTLVIMSHDDYEESPRTWGPVARADLNCDLLHLKSVDFRHYADPNLGGEPMLTMAKMILKRATTLEKMAIEVKEFTNFSSSSDFIKMYETVLSYPRSSHKAEVVFYQ